MPSVQSVGEVASCVARAHASPDRSTPTVGAPAVGDPIITVNEPNGAEWPLIVEARADGNDQLFSSLELNMVRKAQSDDSHISLTRSYDAASWLELCSRFI